MYIEEIIENLNGIEERKYNNNCNISDTYYIFTYDCNIHLTIKNQMVNIVRIVEDGDNYELIDTNNIIYNQSKYAQVEYV